MKFKYIKITELDDLSTFISKAVKVEGDVLVHREKFCVDGKSIMGMMSIDVSQGCKIEYPESAKEFDTYISQFEIQH